MWPLRKFAVLICQVCSSSESQNFAFKGLLEIAKFLSPLMYSISVADFLIKISVALLNKQDTFLFSIWNSWQPIRIDSFSRCSYTDCLWGLWLGSSFGPVSISVQCVDLFMLFLLLSVPALSIFSEYSFHVTSSHTGQHSLSQESLINWNALGLKQWFSTWESWAWTNVHGDHWKHRYLHYYS